MAISFTGSCNCGSLRLEADGHPLFQGFCRCTDCRKASGGHSAAITRLREDVKVSGDFRSYVTTGDSGAAVHRNFCPTCGCLAFNLYPGEVGIISINAGLLDNPEVFDPEVVLYERSAVAWDHIDPRLPRFEEMRPPNSGTAA